MYEYFAKITRVIDGDTIIADVSLGFGLTQNMKFRIIAENNKYFDTPETWRPKSEAEREHGEKANIRARELLEGKTFRIKSIKKGKYRYLCKIILENGSDYADLMISEGFQKKESYD